MNELQLMPKFAEAHQALMEATAIDEIKKIRDQAQSLNAYIKQQGMSLEMQNNAAEIKIRSERKAGEILAGMNLKTGNPQWSHDATIEPTLDDLDINKTQSSRWQKIAGIPEEVFEDEITKKMGSDEELTSSYMLDVAKGKPHVANNSGNNEWYTPVRFIELAHCVMGSIDLDPASSEIANKVVQAEKYYTKEDDGLSKDWYGTVWLNPPYAGNLIGKFIDKLYESWDDGKISQAIILVNNATETSWFQKLGDRCAAVLFPSSRIKFLDPEGNSGAPLQGQALIYLGKNSSEFVDEFGMEGLCFIND